MIVKLVTISAWQDQIVLFFHDLVCAPPARRSLRLRFEAVSSLE